MDKITRQRLHAFLLRHRSGVRTLDVGAGEANHKKYFPQSITVDINPERKPDVVGDIHALPFKDGEFEIVLCLDVLEHVRDPRKAVSELMRVVAPGGKLLFATRFVFPLHDTPGDYWRFTEYGLRDLFGEWEIEELIPETGVFSALAVLLQRISFQTRLRANKLMKFFILICTWIFARLDGLVVEEYGDIERKQKASHIMATGYYLSVRKRA